MFLHPKSLKTRVVIAFMTIRAHKGPSSLIPALPLLKCSVYFKNLNFQREKKVRTH